MIDRDIKNHCPFGCTAEDIDEKGYCHHLVGFTSDGKLMERVQIVRDKDGEDTGHRRVLGGRRGKLKEAIAKTDKLVNPTFQQLDQGVWHTAYSWVSARVYREDVPAPTEKPYRANPDEEDDETLEELTRPAGAK